MSSGIIVYGTSWNGTTRNLTKECNEVLHTSAPFSLTLAGNHTSHSSTHFALINTLIIFFINKEFRRTEQAVPV
jgi:hypothetical protein